MEEEPLSEEDVKKIATLPTLDEARGKIVGILSAPAQKIISILLAPGAKIAILAAISMCKTYLSKSNDEFKLNINSYENASQTQVGWGTKRDGKRASIRANMLGTALGGQAPRFRAPRFAGDGHARRGKS